MFITSGVDANIISQVVLNHCNNLLSADVVQKKWNNLRTYYLKEVAKIAKFLKSGVSADQVSSITRRLQWFDR